ncbi:MAG: peptidase M14 [Acidobacteria bacterium]|nr:peptidase M14 [Acidobacteriota bacterium]MBK8151275.1 peptidase M14 [Acidobacteriota bacterium]
MRKLLPLLTFLLILLTFNATLAQSPEEFAEIWEKNHVSTILPSNMRHKDVLDYLEKMKALGIKVEEIGRSFANREIYQMEWGKGPMRILMWSQMHGDEPTATTTLFDMFAYLQQNGDAKWVRKFSETFTIRAVPMLNPDGAELFQRNNLQGIDINRDATNLATPEGRLLKKLRDEWVPNIGFNLHNQHALTAAGPFPKQAAISLLAVLGNKEGITNAGHERNKRIASAVVLALNKFIRGHIGRWNEEYNGLAFGDNFSAWGTPVILVETGALYGKDEMFLVKMNFVAFLTALQSIADRTEENLSPINYEMLPVNTPGRLAWWIFRNASIVNPPDSLKPFTSDIAVNRPRRRAEQLALTVVSNIGRLSNITGLEEYDASEFYVVPRTGKIRIGGPGELMFYKRSRQIDWRSPNLETAFPPDAIFTLGGWLKGENVVPKKK